MYAIQYNEKWHRFTDKQNVIYWSSRDLSKTENPVFCDVILAAKTLRVYLWGSE
jgi:hypothetical protein